MLYDRLSSDLLLIAAERVTARETAGIAGTDRSAVLPSTSVNRALAGARIAIVHEWIDAYAGSEQVFEALAQMFPSAELYALSRNPSVHLKLGGRPIRTTFLDRPSLRERRALTLPIMPFAWHHLPGAEYDLVISSHHAFAHGNRLAAREGVHLCYVHSPGRYIWSPELDQRGSNPLLTPVRALLRRADLRAAKAVTAYAANSSAVSERVRRFWGREASVINPPVRVSYFAQPSTAVPTRDYVLGVGRWVAYKNLHLVVEAGDLARLPVIIAGRGPEKARIVAAAAKASVPVRIIESPNDETLRELYRNAACLVFPTVEDFGIVQVEAQAAGTAVVALNAGGATDIVVPGKTGLLVDDAAPHLLAAAIGLAADISPEQCASNARRFQAEAFAANISAWVESELLRRPQSPRP